MLKVSDLRVRAENHELSDRSSILEMLKFHSGSPELYTVMAEAYQRSRELSRSKAEVHAQLCMNIAPCPKNCAFCSFAVSNKIFSHQVKLAVEEVVRQALLLEGEGRGAKASL